jgi:hypothetical protein
MKYYLYQITNNVNNKIYVGVHKTKDLNDGYMGSGKIIKRAINKHGIDNFTKVILEQFDNAEAMYAKEKEIVTPEFLLREDTYNLRRGGSGGFDYINKTGKNLYGTNGIGYHGSKNFIPGNISRDQRIKNGNQSEFLKKVSVGVQAAYDSGKLVSIFTTNNPMKNPVYKQKQKESLAQIQHQQGEKNSSFGKKFITDGSNNRKILKELPIPDGWRLGRIFKTKITK